MNKDYNHKETVFIIYTIVWLFLIQAGRGQSQPAPVTTDDYYGPPITDMNISFRPSVAVVIGILAVMFALTFLLLIYAKFCHIAVSTNPVYINNFRGHLDDHALISTSRSARFSGIDKTLIESLPFFKFSTLKGSKRGLECAVCLSKFEDAEVLRLLPKCKHAFHINCVDQWLESHSSCPLCRHKVHAEDLSMFKLSNSSRLSHNPSSLDLREDPNIELFVQREQDHEQQHLGSSSSRFSIGSSFRKNENGKKYNEDQELLILNSENGSVIDHQEVRDDIVIDEGHHCEDSDKNLDKFKHKIIVSDIMYKNRWSNLSSSDLISLNSEMLNFMSSKRFSPPGCSTSNSGDVSSGHEETSIPTKTTASSRSTFLNSETATKRSMSEITSISRLSHFGFSKIKRVEPNNPSGKEERISRLWFPIVRKTVEWIAGREKRMKQPHDHEDHPKNSRLVSIV
ncbi:hypothetical protein C5167_019740 [Papaver somniferum]|uniref:RING-type E3 ubiquitin transferase n=1 Tax=Papaver somniferum TaxID=3469 RepID=A0A4Y7IV45_PAPSO|nr:E3 ubiquitin-protein ligase ATL42-like [Papaver somniferum]RZC51305.1 hypothetical protein C5167_019740 [Papaver somniferum]